jgi:hypothetical protein
MQHLLRRKIISILIVFIVLPFIGLSQSDVEQNLPDHDSKLYHFGINLGFNRSYSSFTTHPNFLLQDSVMGIESLNSTGLSLGWMVNLNLNEHFDIRTYPVNLTFSETAFQYTLLYPDRPGGESTLTKKSIQSISVSLPLQLKFSSDRLDNFRVYTFAGGKISYDFSANAGKQNADENIQLKGFDYGIQGGIGFHFYYPYFVLTPEINFSWGLANLHSRNPSLKFSSNIDKINSRMITFSLMVE